MEGRVATYKHSNSGKKYDWIGQHKVYGFEALLNCPFNQHPAELHTNTYFSSDLPCGINVPSLAD